MATLPDDLHDLERSLLDAIAAAPAEGEPVDVAGVPLEDIFVAQVQSRALDHTARWLRARGHGYYTIGSAGHESNAAVAAALRLTDPALLHYRSGGFYCARALQRPGHDAVRDVLMGKLALAAEPIAGGRHKVFGHRELNVIPQTSTIASHLPRAVGVALAIGRARRLGVRLEWPLDAVAVCSFGDASANHSTAQGAINAACYSAHNRLPVPLLFVCEDNGWGISVPTPTGWVEASLANRPDLRYQRVDGTDPVAVYRTTLELADEIRRTGRPALLHLRTVRYLGHAGTDVESGYRSAASIRRDLARDPIAATATALIETGRRTAEDLIAHVLAARAEVRTIALDLVEHPTLATRDEVIEPLSPRRPDVVRSAASQPAPPAARTSGFGERLPEDEGPLTLAESINRALTDVLAATKNTLVFGEDVGVKGGVYGVTRGLQRRFGAARVFDSLLDEHAILGLALGAGVSGFVPIPEIQYLAYLHNAEDQLRGEGASLSFFSNGQYRNPMVVRIAGYAYQRGFGGHFHNDNAIGVLRDIPGLVIASPAHPSDAAPMLRTCVAAAALDGTVSVFLEPIALYHTRDLHEEGDGVWTAPYAAPERWADEHVPVGAGRLVRDGDDVLIVTWANGLAMSLRAAKRLAGSGISCRVYDLRWLAPMPLDDVVEHAEALGKVLVVDETRHSGGAGEGIVAGLVERGFGGSVARVAADDSFVPLGEAANLVLVDVETIVEAATELAHR
ncbi:MAG: thiamine pyrophosphate-dependent enzyme [Ilumatobacter sp.]|nr:thiamine pyrophosphate-dependent enzyme [Ilumatobacter sp.]MDJ0769680.1 thiamine pyrophosphate-dependent enzyme [Ilumatobacter sp.]